MLELSKIKSSSVFIKISRTVLFLGAVFLLTSAILYFQYFSKPSVEIFAKEAFGIAVANFKGETEPTIEKGKELKGIIVQNLNFAFRQYPQKYENVIVKAIDEIIIPEEGEAEKIGKEYNADLLIYGRISEGNSIFIVPWLTILDPEIKEKIAWYDIILGKHWLKWEEVRIPSTLVETPKIFYLSAEAIALQRKREYTESRRKLDDLLNISTGIDSFPVIDHFLGNLYFDQAILEPDTLERKKFLKLAKREYEEVIKAESDFPDAYFRLGYLYLEEKNIKETVAYFEGAVNLQRSNYKYNYDLLTSYIQIDSLGKAEKGILTFLAANPEIQYTAREKLNNLLQEIEKKRFP